MIGFYKSSLFFNKTETNPQEPKINLQERCPELGWRLGFEANANSPGFATPVFQSCLPVVHGPGHFCVMRVSAFWGGSNAALYSFSPSCSGF